MYEIIKILDLIKEIICLTLGELQQLLEKVIK